MVYLSGRSDFKTRRNNCAAHVYSNDQTIAQALGHQTARMALQSYGSVTDEVADKARKQTFTKYSWL